MTTGTETYEINKPKEFEINNDNTISDQLYWLRKALPSLIGRNYRFKVEDIQEAIWMATELSVIMQVGLNDLLGGIAVQYRVAQRDIPASQRLPKDCAGVLDLELAQEGFDQ